MGNKRKNVDQLTKDLEDVIRKLYTQIQGTDEEKREAITKEVEAKINSIESAQKARKASRFKARAGEIPDDLETLMREFNYEKKTSLYALMSKNGIYGKGRILQAIKEKAELGISEEEANKQIAEEGNVTLDAVARIRQENNGVSRFKQRAAEIPDDTETLMIEFGYASIASVFRNMKSNGIYTKSKILKEIQEKTKLGISEEEANKQIAKEGNVTVEAVARIRQENRIKEGKERQSKLGEKAARFKERAAEIPDDTETLMKEFNYKNRKVVTFYMVSYGIYGKRKIIQAIKEKAELGISEEEANKQIAREGNVTVEAVARIRQGISKPKTNSTRVNVQPSSTQIKTIDKSEVRPDARTVAVQSRVVEPKTEKTVKTTEDAKKPITHTTDTKPGVNLHVAKQLQKEKQVQRNEIEEARQREIEQKRLEKELQRVSKENAKKEQAIRQESEVFLKMARELHSIESIQGKFQYIDRYDMILLLRKHKILSREEVEELIETTSLLDEEIAQRANAETAVVQEVRESIRKKKELIAKVSDTKRNFIIKLIKESRIC